MCHNLYISALKEYVLLYVPMILKLYVQQKIIKIHLSTFMWVLVNQVYKFYIHIGQRKISRLAKICKHFYIERFRNCSLPNCIFASEFLSHSTDSIENFLGESGANLSKSRPKKKKVIPVALKENDWKDKICVFLRLFREFRLIINNSPFHLQY